MSLRSLNQCLPAVAGDALKKRGFGEFKILNDWERVVGAHLARLSTPIKIVFERGKNTNGALHIQVASSVAPEIQHLQPIILERIASYFGYPAVGRLVLQQTHGAFMPPREKSPAPAAIDSGQPEHPAAAACGDEMLRESLASLARTVFNNKQ
jgi:hypothetical protein